MITIGKQYMVFKPKEKLNSKGERIVYFSIGNSSFDKTTNSWISKGFINVVAKSNQVIEDRQKVIFSEINSIDTNEYEGRQTVTLFVTLSGEKPTGYEAVSGSDLPF